MQSRAATITHRTNTVQAPSAKRRWAALVVLMLPVLLVSVDGTALSFAVPMMSAALDPTGAQLLWIVDVYPLVLAGLLVPMGSTGDRIGRRKLLLIGATGFTIVSALAAFAPSAGFLIAARAVMGFFGAMLMPSTLSLIRNIFTVPGERRTAIAVWAAGFSGGAALGPIAGGFLLEHFYWGSIFLMAVPVLAPFLILAPLLVPESKDPNPGRVDPASIGLILLTMVPLVYSIKTFSHYGMSAPLTLLLAVALVAGGLFVRRQLGESVPMLDVRLFTNPVFSGAVTVNLLSIFSQAGFLYFVSQHLQLVSGLSPITAGMYLLPGLILTIVSGLAVVPIVRRIRPGYVVTLGLLCNAAAFALVAYAGPAGWDLGLVIAFGILGVGVGAAETISNDLILGAVPAHKAGAASAISETAYETGSVLGTAVLGSILNAAYRSHIVIPESLTASQASTARETLGGATHLAGTLDSGTAQVLMESAHGAFDSGVLITSIIGVAFMVIASLIALTSLRSASA